MTRRVERVAVVGRDAQAWLAACAIRRALGAACRSVSVVDLPSELAAADVYAAAPSLASLHRMLGLAEKLALGACCGLPMAAQRLSNWGKSAPPFFLAYDSEPPADSLPFTQYWVKAALEGLQVGLEDFSFGSACARLGRVPTDAVGAPPGISASYGYHLDARKYSELVRQHALRLGVERIAASTVTVEAEGDRIFGLHTREGTRVTADLYIDASGDRVLARKLGAEFESWKAWLMCDRMIACSGPPLNDLPVFSQISAFAAGWIGLLPLSDRTAVVAVYSSNEIDDEELARQISVIARLPTSGEAVVSALEPGALRNPWIGNCIAIGDSAVRLGPLDGLSLHAAHAGISHLMTLFPATADSFPEADAYNRVIGAFIANVRDFQVAHFKLNRRFDDPMWDRARDVEAPDSLTRRMDLFSARSIVTLGDEETFLEPAWAALFVGSGLMPTGYDPRIDLVPREQHIAQVQQRLRTVADVARRMPAMDQFLGVQERIVAQAGA